MKRPSLHACQQNLFELGATTPASAKEPSAKKDHVFEMTDALTAPILTFSPQWADAIPKRILDIIPLSRMIALGKGEELATYAECTVYLYTRSLEAPMESEWADIYLHVGCKTLEQWFQEDRWKQTGAPLELTGWLSKKLHGLRQFIYTKRRQLLKQRLKGEEQPDAQAPEITEQKPVLSKQQSFF